ncbi:MAG: hypothetical protein COV76_05135 [Candidatus Omnitrophica bacterium CG11_big_fil_rev_8_21_14_0_20_64_10]|nr:MAG: hypothetical protein COV76_05135 [Candidatus Omnitrophica bacterium CG11_big_fil_rev_8_21_14_0_20_64_10]
MKKLQIILILLIAALAAGWWFASNWLKAELPGMLSQALAAEVTLKETNLRFPLGLELKGIRIAPKTGEPVTADALTVQANPLSLLSGQPQVTLELDRPSWRLHRTAAGFEWPFPTGTPAGGKGGAGVPSKEGKAPPILFTLLSVKNGSLALVDEAVQPTVTWSLQPIEVTVRMDPASQSAHWQVQSVVSEGGKEIGAITSEGEGKLDGSAKGSFKIRHSALQQLAPYIRPTIGTVPVSGRLTLESRFDLKQGNLQSDNAIAAEGLVFPEGDETLFGTTGNRMVKLLRDRDGVIRLNIPVSGRVETPEDWGRLTSAAVQEALRRALTKTIQNVLTDKAEQTVGELLNKALESINR